MLLDACCAINLFATPYACEILAAFAQPIAIAQFVVEHEVTTPELVKQWAEHAHIDRLLLRSVLTDIETKARFRPGRSHPLYAWWQASVW